MGKVIEWQNECESFFETEKMSIKSELQAPRDAGSMISKHHGTGADEINPQAEPCDDIYEDDGNLLAAPRGNLSHAQPSESKKTSKEELCTHDALEEPVLTP